MGLKRRGGGDRNKKKKTVKQREAQRRGPLRETGDHRLLFKDGFKFASSSGERKSPGGSQERQTAANH